MRNQRVSHHVCGWVVRQGIFDRRGKRVSSWWCGPDRAWGQSFGPLFDEETGTVSMTVAVFGSRKEARDAITTIGVKGCTPMPLDQALDEFGINGGDAT